MPYDYTKYDLTAEVVRIAKENLNKNISQYQNIEQGLREYNYNPSNIFGKNYCLKPTSTFAEAVESVSDDVLDSYLSYGKGGWDIMLTAFKTGAGNIVDTYLIGETAIGETVMDNTVLIGSVMGSLGAFFGKWIDTAIWTNQQQFASDVAFWKEKFRELFGENHGYYLLDGYGNIFLDKATLDRAYDIFASLPQGEGDGVWYDSEGETLPLVFAHGVLEYSDSGEALPFGVMRRDVTISCSDPNVIFGVGRVNVGGVIGYQIGFYYKYPVIAGTVNIEHTVTDLYTDGTSTTNTYNTPVTVPEYGSTYDISLGGTSYRYMDMFTGYANDMRYWRTVPSAASLEILTSFPPSGLVGVTQETPALQVSNIPGVAQPTLGGTIPGTYPTWENDKINRNITGDGVVDDTIEDPYYPIMIFEPGNNPPTSQDIDDMRQTPTTMPDVEDKHTWIFPVFIDDLLDVTGDNVKDSGIPGGSNPSVPTGVNAGVTPLPPSVIPTDSGQDSGFMAVYHPNKTIVRTFSNWLWSVGFDLDTFKKMFFDPMQAIVSLHEVFVHPTDAGATTIQLGYVDTNISTAYINDTSYVLNCGTLKIPEFYQNTLDYEPYTTFDIFLPFIGFRKLQASDIVDNYVTVSYTIDLITGSCVADIIVDKGTFKACMYQFTGNCAIQIPISSGNFNQIISNAIGIAASGFATLASGGSLAPLMIGATANALTNSRAQVERGGTLGGNAGALTYKKPFIICTRQKSVVPYEYEKFTGFPASSQIRLGRCEGYTRVKSCHLEDMKGTDREKRELERILKEGIIV